ncbi:MAG TPA: 16S rRNA (cytidine(1402)-2'-O)-methyltransferase [Candidatus Polarisedimenticolia bacterium]|nr:16S rRNA (cytidine(1402)-2'-O)-methyltransferase [Candidatus Polarisedimenticolia bacterium]
MSTGKPKSASRRSGSLSNPGTGSEPSESGEAEQSRCGIRQSGLTIVATPIGNAADIGLRALDVLKNADAILCEDTRVSMKLLTRHGIRRPLLAYHEHNAARTRPKILARLREGESLALIADAGTPLVSDPGYKLVQAAIAEGMAVTAVPGASAALAALVLSSLPPDRFFFAGFLSARAGQRREELRELAAIPATLIVYEAANRLAETLADMATVLGSRAAAVARELTKLFEEVRRADLPSLAAHYATAPVKGEVVIVIGPPVEGESAGVDAIEAALGEALKTMSLRDAVDQVAAATGAPRRTVYQRALAMTSKPSSPDDEG